MALWTRAALDADTPLSTPRPAKKKEMAPRPIPPVRPPAQGPFAPWGVALGGGAMRGLAHLGVLERLLPVWGHPQAMAGSSVGAVVAAALASGHTIADLQQWARSITRRDLLVVRHRDLWLQRLQIDSLFAWEALEGLIAELVPRQLRMGDLAMDLRVVATHLVEGHAVVFSPAETPDVLVHEAVRASASIPGVFPQVLLNQCPLTDGMISMPVPATILPDHLPRVAVSLSGRGGGAETTGVGTSAIATSMQAMNLIAYRLTRSQLGNLADLRLIEPQVSSVPPLSFQHADRLIDAGRRAADDALRLGLPLPAAPRSPSPP